MNSSMISKARDEIFGIATLWIALFHSSYINFSNVTYLPNAVTSVLDAIRRSGNIGVDIFLIFAGIGAYYSMSADPGVISFYKRRFKRLFPTVFICAVFWFGMKRDIATWKGRGAEIISRRISNCMGCCAGEQPPARLTDHNFGQNAKKTGSLHSAFLESKRALGH